MLIPLVGMRHWGWGEAEAGGAGALSGWGCGGDDTEDDRCQGTSPILHHPVVPVTCPKKCRASHAENAALPATELNRDAGPRQLMPSDGIYLPRRSVCELPVRSVAAPGTRQRPTCVERQQQSFANSTWGQKRFLPTAAEQPAAAGRSPSCKPLPACLRAAAARPRRKSTGTSTANERYFISCRRAQLGALWSRRLHLPPV